MITLYGAVANGLVWGIGYTKSGACFDASMQLQKLVMSGADASTAPTEDFHVEEITIEDCKRICDGDTTWRKS
jgi:hypothetical protein